jgi:uncharacterized SAM-binding protein YcdF (DUF218 family)
VRHSSTPTLRRTAAHRRGLVTSHRHPASTRCTGFRLLWEFLVGRTALCRSDVLFCFGSLDLDVPRRAARLYAVGVAPWVLVTGRGPASRRHKSIPEAELFRQVLVEHGVPLERIVVERDASNIGENVRLGVAALGDRGIQVTRASLVTWPLSVRRCRATFARWFPRVCTYPVPSCEDMAAYEAAGARGWGAAVGELRRLDVYPGLGFISPQPIPDTIWRAAQGRLCPAG